MAAAFVLPGCMTGPGVSGSFDRNYTVSGHTRLEVTDPSGQVNITGSADGQVHIYAEVHAHSMGFEKPRERLDQTLADPGIEQKGDTIRVGKRLSSMRNLSIDYKIEVPHDTEVNVTALSGSGPAYLSVPPVPRRSLLLAMRAPRSRVPRCSSCRRW